MKATALVLLCFLALSLAAVVEKKPADGAKAVETLKKREKGVCYAYLFTFKDGFNNKEYRAWLKKSLDACKSKNSIEHAEIDQADPKFATLVSTLKVNENTDKFPTVFYMCEGSGDWVHGPASEKQFNSRFNAAAKC